MLITTDSILHALHSSYDALVKRLEESAFAPALEKVLIDAHRALGESRASLEAMFGDQLDDVELHLTVAIHLLAWNPDAALAHASQTLDATAVDRVLRQIRSYKAAKTSLYGSPRRVDFSQFRPRGHYTDSPGLKRYFQAMMWLGRADLAFELDDATGRQLLDSVLLAGLLDRTGGDEKLAKINSVIDFLVGRADSLTLAQLLDAMRKAGIKGLASLQGADARKRLVSELDANRAGVQAIRSQRVSSSPRDSVKTRPPAIFQLFGQRFTLDSFLLSKVVFDSIVHNGVKQGRMMPSGLDVMAALGNDTAVVLLEKQLKAHNYAPNLLGLRDYVDEKDHAYWGKNLHVLWLDTLRVLDDDFSEQKHLPEVMQTSAWQRKQLQTQLGSWAELRHDTLLYAKQSYTSSPECGYPAAYVEPYPDVYARIAHFAREANRLLGDLEPKRLGQVRKFLGRMEEITTKLQKLAEKELRAEPFTLEEQLWLKKTIDRTAYGSGPPRYDGWYPDLFLERDASHEWDPVVADVHTDPSSRQVLQVGVGDVGFGLVAIDNAGDRMAYVGPLYSYYEFRHPASDRLTDEKWQSMIAGAKVPARPAWTKPFLGDAKSRKMGPQR